MSDEYIVMTDDEMDIYMAAEEESEQFVIDNESKCNWAIKVIKDETAETDRILSIINDQITQLTKKAQDVQESLNRRTGYLKGLLYNYFLTVPHKETKTQSQYKLLDGTLVFKKPSVKIVRPENDDQLVAYLEQGQPDLIDTIKKPRWGEFKKNLTLTDDGEVVDMATGEKLDFVKTEEDPGSFDVKVV